MIIEHGKKFVEDLKKKNEATKGLQYRIDWYENKIIEYQKIYESIKTGI
jgi:hypothetical protein